MKRIEQQVKRKAKRSTGILKVLMVVFAILFLLMGIMFDRGFMLFCIVFLGMYYWFSANAGREYEYIYVDGKLTINVIKGSRKLQQVQYLDTSKLEVVAPYNHSAVAMYKKSNGSKLPKFDYTSYEDDIMYYTMIITDESGKKIKLLLDLNEEMLTELRRKNPQKVYM